MRTFAPAPKVSPLTASAKPSWPGRVDSKLKGNTGNIEAGPVSSGQARFGHDFSQLPPIAKSSSSHSAKLRLNAAGDRYEQEANRIADHVMRMPEPGEEYGRSETAGRAQTGSANEVAGQRVVHEVLLSPGEALDPATRLSMEPRLGYDFTGVRIHSDERAAESAKAVGAAAYTVGHNIVFNHARYAPQTEGGKRLLAHELTHVVQQGFGVAAATVQRYGTPIPAVDHPTVVTMRQYIDLVRRVEAASPGSTALQTAQKLMRTKYHTQGFDWLLPSTAGAAGVSASGSVTADDVTTLTGEFDVTLPQGGVEDASHVVTGIVAAAEKQAPGASGAGGTSAKILVSAPPPGLTQLDIASWAGDPGSAAGEWATVHPLPKGGTTMQAYLDEFSPESDLIGDVDGIAMTSTSVAAGFAFDPTAPLSDNLDRFYFPTAPREGKNRRFHTFCSVIGFGLEPDGVTLNSAASAAIDQKVKGFADWYTANDPNILAWMAINSPPPMNAGGGMGGMGSFPTYNPIYGQWVARANDWKWFAQKFRDFVQRNLNAEGP